MKSTWSGTITFGLVSIPVNVYTATEDSGPALNFVHESDHGRVSQQWLCKDCGQVIGWSELAKGHNIGTDKAPEMLVLSAPELAGIEVKSREAQVLEFVTLEEIPVQLYGSLYYLAPTPPAIKGQKRAAPGPHHTRAYVLLRETLRRTGLVALVDISLRNRPARAMLSVDGDVIVMRTLLYPAQIREHDFNGYVGGVIPDCELTDAELDTAEALVRAMTGKYDPATHVDSYAVALGALVDGKRPAPEVAEPVSNVVPLFAVLDEAMAGAR
jgi:DNA end-binding protein Ku